jgi:hypothetical protein
MSNDDLKELGTVLDNREAGLIVIHAPRMSDQVAASIKAQAQNRFVTKAINADADGSAKQPSYGRKLNIGTAHLIRIRRTLDEGDIA